MSGAKFEKFPRVRSLKSFSDRKIASVAAKKTITSVIVHVCSCGKSFTRSMWSALPFVGFFVDDTDVATWSTGVPGRGVVLEHRNCSCGSTRALPIGFDQIVLIANAQAKALRSSAPSSESVLIERERCAQVAEEAGAHLRVLASSGPGVEVKHALFQRAELCDEIASSIRGERR